jgi:hypothetical protein
MKAEYFLLIIGVIWLVLGLVNLSIGNDALAAIQNSTGAILLGLNYVLIDIKEHISRY